MSDEILKAIFAQCYIDWSHGRRGMLVVDGIVELTEEQTEWLEKSPLWTGEEPE